MLLEVLGLGLGGALEKQNKKKPTLKLSAKIQGPEKGGQTLVCRKGSFFDLWRESGPGPESLLSAWHPSGASSAPQTGKSTQPSCSVLDSKPRRAQMSVQFTAHSKLDHSSGVWFRPGTCDFLPSL